MPFTACTITVLLFCSGLRIRGCDRAKNAPRLFRDGHRAPSAPINIDMLKLARCAGHISSSLRKMPISYRTLFELPIRVTRTPTCNCIGKSDWTKVGTTAFDDEADSVAALNVEYTLLYQKAVHSRIEVAVIRHVIDVSVYIVIHPASRDLGNVPKFRSQCAAAKS